MTNETRESIMHDIGNAANTCNELVEIMQSKDAPVSQTGLMNLTIMALVGINQALVAIAAAIACREDKEND